MPSQRPDVSLFFPVYRDEKTVRRVTEKALAVLAREAAEHEVIIVDDGSPDASGAVADELARQYRQVRVIHHDGNRGYGEALKSGFAAARYEWICQTDGDDEYEVADLTKLLRVRESYDLVITFRYVKRYSGLRIFISWVYNRLLSFLFQTRYRDVSTGLRLVRKTVVDDVELTSSSPFLGAELAVKALLKGYRVGEVGIQTFPRTFRRGASVTPANIRATLGDMLRCRREIFSPSYDLPPDRRRSGPPSGKDG